MDYVYKIIIGSNLSAFLFAPIAMGYTWFNKKPPTPLPTWVIPLICSKVDQTVVNAITSVEWYKSDNGLSYVHGNAVYLHLVNGDNDNDIIVRALPCVAAIMKPEVYRYSTEYSTRLDRLYDMVEERGVEIVQQIV